MRTPARPYPFDVEFENSGYRKPPSQVLQRLGIPWYTRESLPWFPERSQSGAVSESILPPQSEAVLSVSDRTGGFGWSLDPRRDPTEPLTVYAYTGKDDADGQGVDCSWENLTLLGPKQNNVVIGGSVALDAHFELTVGGTRYVYLVAGTKLYRSSDGTTFAAVQANGADLPGALSGRPAVFRGAQGADLVYFPLGSATDFRVWNGNPATGFGVPPSTTYALQNKVIDFLAVDDYLLGLYSDIAATGVYRIAKFYDGIAAGGTAASDPYWLPSIVASDASDAAQFLLLSDERILVGCNRTLRSLAEDRGRMDQVLWETTPSTTNFKQWVSAPGELWFVAGAGVPRIENRGGTLILDTYNGPEALPNNQTPVRGTVTALARDDHFKYLFVRNANGTTYQLKHRRYDGGRRDAYHSILEVGDYTVSYAFVSTIQGTNPRLYYGYLSGGSLVLAYNILPRTGQHPLNDTNYRFCAKGCLYETRMYGGMHFISKALLAWTGRGKNFSATETVTPRYRTTQDGSWTVFGSLTVNTDPGARIALDAAVAASWWELKLCLATGADTKTPQLFAGSVGYAMRPPAKGKFTIVVWIANGIQNRAGTRDHRSAAQLETALIALDSGSTTTTMRNKRGLSYDILVDRVKVVSLGNDTDADAPDAVAIVEATEIQARGAGSHSALSAYTHGELAAYTHSQLTALL